ncbi:translation initiation factor IF-3 [bacterium]|nr:translation initiation factor IF-3 [bacterium]
MIRRTSPRRYQPKNTFQATVNRYISYPQLRVMDDQGQSLGVMDRQAALDMATAQKKDLVLITDKADPPVAKIIELSKFKYQMSQKKAAERRRSRAQDIKEIRLRPFVDENDLQTKIRKAREFLSRRHKVRLSMELRGRAITKQDLAHQILDRFISEIADVSTVETDRKLIGKKIQVQLMPAKKIKANAAKLDENTQEIRSSDPKES